MTPAAWSNGNAWALLAASMAAYGFETAWPLALAGAGSFTVLIVTQRRCWTPDGRFGAANAVTAARLTAVLALALMHSSLSGALIVGAAIAILAGDGVDGWLARRRGESSTFGEYLDKECDALLLLVLVYIAVLQARIGDWLLVVGLARYLFVLGAARLAPTARADRKSRRAGIVSVLTLVAVLSCFVLPLAIYGPFAALATVALAGSFAVDVAAWFKPASPGVPRK